MTIIIKRNKSEKIKVDKDLEVLSTLVGTLRDETDVINPVITIQGLDEYLIKEGNYLEIVEFGRSYFVLDTNNVRNGLWEITCHVDVLSSFKDEIRQNTAVVSRQENTYNLYLDDGIFKVYNNPNIVTKSFPSGFTSQRFVLAVAGKYGEL